MTRWRKYEQKRAALERKWKPKVFKALQQQLSSFIDDFTEGKTLRADMTLLPVITAIYKDCGRRMAHDTKRELNARKKAHNVIMRTKFRGFGSGQDFAELVSQSLQMQGLNLAQRMSETTKKRIALIIAYGQEQGWSIQEIVTEIRLRIREVNKARVVTITRTEVGRSASEGKLIGAMAMGIMMDKIWVSANDERTRRRPRDKADHLRMHNNRIELDKIFENGLLIPGDSSGPAHETINCRCTVVFEPILDNQGNTIPKQYLKPVRSLNFIEGLTAGLGLTTLLTD